MTTPHLVVNHWGVHEVARGESGPVLSSWRHDPAPSALGLDLPKASRSAARVLRPAVRRSWLAGARDTGAHRSTEPFVQVGWDDALDLVARELARVRAERGPEAIFAGSYGWASAGRFHHAPSQLHRFMATGGGYTGHVGTYSTGAAEVVVPHVLGTFGAFGQQHTTWELIADHGELVVAFGGIPLRNTAVDSGGVRRHVGAAGLARCVERGVSFVNVGPQELDLSGARWLAIRPGTDTALLLALTQTIVAEDAHDRAFLDRYCVGADRYLGYLAGGRDGVVKDAAWAAAICGIDPADIVALARRMVAHRTLVNVSWSLQRAHHGEQPYWAAIALAAVLGQIGLPGGGIGFGYGTVNRHGSRGVAFPGPGLPPVTNPARSAIPVARFADALLAPGARIDVDGATITYPELALVYWAGGNPFHHHQDLNRLLRAWARPETIVVHEQYWTPTARRADIVLPVTTTLERDDIAATSLADGITASKKAADPPGESRHDHVILAALAEHAGHGAAFHEGLGERGWLRRIWDDARRAAPAFGLELVDFDTFWAAGEARYADGERDHVLLGNYRADPDRHRLHTPSGRIEIWSGTIEGFGYDDCPGHPTWLEPAEWLGGDEAARFGLALVTSQPERRLHSQLDFGPYSQATKVAGREPVHLHPDDAEARGITDGEIVRLFNDRGQCLAGAVVTDRIRRGVVHMATGAWFDPLDAATPGSLDVAGNPNVLTPDLATSRLAQGCGALTCLVEVVRWDGPTHPVRAHGPPQFDDKDPR